MPPASFPGDRMFVGNMLVSRQGVADQDGIRLLRVELAVGLIGDRQGAQRDTGIHLERTIGAEMHHEAIRRVDLAKTRRFAYRNELHGTCRSFGMTNIIFVIWERGKKRVKIELPHLQAQFRHRCRSGDRDKSAVHGRASSPADGIDQSSRSMVSGWPVCAQKSQSGAKVSMLA